MSTSCDSVESVNSVMVDATISDPVLTNNSFPSTDQVNSSLIVPNDEMPVPSLRKIIISAPVNAMPILLSGTCTSATDTYGELGDDVPGTGVKSPSPSNVILLNAADALITSLSRNSHVPTKAASILRGSPFLLSPHAANVMADNTKSISVNILPFLTTTRTPHCFFNYLALAKHLTTNIITHLYQTVKTTFKGIAIQLYCNHAFCTISLVMQNECRTKCKAPFGAK